MGWGIGWGLVGGSREGECGGRRGLRIAGGGVERGHVRVVDGPRIRYHKVEVSGYLVDVKPDILFRVCEFDQVLVWITKVSGGSEGGFRWLSCG